MVEALPGNLSSVRGPGASAFRLRGYVASDSAARRLEVGAVQSLPARPRRRSSEEPRLPAFPMAGRRESANRPMTASTGRSRDPQARAAHPDDSEISPPSSPSTTMLDEPGRNALTKLKERFVTIHTIHRV